MFAPLNMRGNKDMQLVRNYDVIIISTDTLLKRYRILIGNVREFFKYIRLK